MKELELLSPAKDLATGIAAINCGADAVYIGTPKFGARAAVGNSLSDIKQLIEYAHQFHVKVYITLNTLLYDDELAEAEALIKQCYDIGADAIIIQDMAIFEMDIPPIPIFASTQTNNYSIDQIKFLESIGVKRIILARELSLEQIKEIRNTTTVDLEFFVHGALCVSFSGQCYMSCASIGRSANRGECAQPCRMLYTLEDADGNIIVKDKYLLSLKDLNLSNSIEDLIDAGITSFKIEGRLKDGGYVKNVTAHYRQTIDDVMKRKGGFVRASSGKSKIDFTPDPAKSFNRGFTNYFIDGKGGNNSSFNSQKSIGKYLGKVTKAGNDFIAIDTKEKIVNGDGLCYFDKNDVLQGFSVNKMVNNKIILNDTKPIMPGTKIFRNYNHQFNKELSKDNCARNISAVITIINEKNFLVFSVQDEDGNSASLKIDEQFDSAKDETKTRVTIHRQMSKTGDSIFDVTDVKFDLMNIPFTPVGKVNTFRRELLEMLTIERKKNYKRLTRSAVDNSGTYFKTNLDFKANVTNKLAKQFYTKHGVTEFKEGFELLDEREGLEVMRMKYCIKEELNICPHHNKIDVKFKEPLYIRDFNRKYRLVFDCKKCEMGVIL